MKRYLKRYLWIGIAVLLLVIGLILVKRTAPEFGGSSPEPSVSGSTAPSYKGPAGLLSVTNVTPKIAYDKALTQYQGKLFQFDNRCQALPYPNLVLKNGGTVLVDNRFNKARTLRFDDAKLSLKAYGWAIVKLQYKSKLPHKVLIDCDATQNSGSVLLEK